ncbi:thioesterase II family protein [Maribacter sp. 2307UL18-2]|uniref:thioesterase II family protein n=1 Tax=Maribacter sp. 2307UL18-2 TaxID=3386274 RepID=UPI0039BC91E2
MSKTKLFCFPYAGGSSQIYNKWKPDLNPKIELIPIELSGRGKRMNEPLYKSFKELINDVFQQVRGNLHQTPFAFFGHSLGALIAYELIQLLRKNNFPNPKHVFYSGKSVPHVETNEKVVYHLLDSIDFKREVIKLGGTPPEFFMHPELEELFLPLLKNDFKMAETYNFTGASKRYDGDITVFLGKDDQQTAEQCQGWNEYTSEICKIIYFNGGHFFIHTEMDKIVNIINETLRL